MNRSFATIAIALATLSGAAMADTVIPSQGAVRTTGDSGLTRQEVKAETLQAIRNGDIIAAGELGGTVRAQHPGQYPAVTATANATREQVKRELVDAARRGDLYAGAAYQRDGSRLN